MDETYTCLCGHQEFYIDGSIITCGGCGRMYGLIIENNAMEEPEEFNKRIKKGVRK